MPGLAFLPIRLLLRASKPPFFCFMTRRTSSSDGSCLGRAGASCPTYSIWERFPLPPTSPGNQQHPQTSTGLPVVGGGRLVSKTFPMRGSGSGSGEEGRRRLRCAKGLFQLLSALPVRGPGSRHIRCLVQMSWLGKKKWPLLLPPEPSKIEESY